jgi:hypothetical protein
MLEEVPYGKYIENTNHSNINESNNLVDSCDSVNLVDLETLPVSIEVVPHKAIIIHEVYLQRRDQDENRECPNYVKWLIASSFCIPLVIVLSSVRLQS